MDMNWKSLAAMLPVQPCDELKRDVLMGIYDMHDLGGDLILYHRESVGLADEIGQIMDPQDWSRWERSKKRRWGARCTCTACGEDFIAGYVKNGIVLSEGPDGQTYDGYAEQGPDSSVYCEKVRQAERGGGCSMKLEDATKDELIWWIKEHAFELKYELKHFESDVMFRRYQQFNDKAHSAGERYSKTLAEYSELLSPYKGLPISSIPRDVCKKGANLEQIMLQASKEQIRWWKAADKCLGQYDQIMEETTHG